MTNPLEELRFRLEGKTILKIEEPNAAESICKFILSDGSAFRLHATDLGFWMENTVGTQGYQSLNDLIIDYEHSVYYLTSTYPFGPPPAKLSIDGDKLVFTSPNGKLFEIERSKLTDIENNIINNPEVLPVLLDSFISGYYWKTFFTPRYTKDLPTNCHII